MAIGSLPWGKIAAGLSAPRQGNDFFSAFQAGLGGVVNAQLIEEARRRREMDDEIQRQFREREFGLAESRLGIDRQRADYERRRLEADEAKANAPPEDYGVISGDIQGPLLPGTIRAPQGLPKGGYKSYAEAYGKNYAESLFPKPQQTDNEPLVQVAGPDGMPMYVRRSDAVGKTVPKPGSTTVKGADRTALSYYNRAQDAENTIATIENKIAHLNPAQQLQLRYAPNFAQSPDQQVYRQAQRAFTEARLRKESGAAIPQTEIESDAQTYFAQPGDSPETMERKRLARQQVLNGLKFSAGKAYDEFYGHPANYEGIPGAAGTPTTQSFEELEAKYGH